MEENSRHAGSAFLYITRPFGFSSFIRMLLPLAAAERRERNVFESERGSGKRERYPYIEHPDALRPLMTGNNRKQR